jgi:hypothetical protein
MHDRLSHACCLHDCAPHSQSNRRTAGPKPTNNIALCNQASHNSALLLLCHALHTAATLPLLPGPSCLSHSFPCPDITLQASANLIPASTQAWVSACSCCVLPASLLAASWGAVPLFTRSAFSPSCDAHRHTHSLQRHRQTWYLFLGTKGSLLLHSYSIAAIVLPSHMLTSVSVWCYLCLNECILTLNTHSIWQWLSLGGCWMVGFSSQHLVGDTDGAAHTTSPASGKRCLDRM